MSTEPKPLFEDLTPELMYHINELMGRERILTNSIESLSQILSYHETGNGGSVNGFRLSLHGDIIINYSPTSSSRTSSVDVNGWVCNSEQLEKLLRPFLEHQKIELAATRAELRLYIKVTN